MGKGYIIVQLSTALEALPITEASVKIIDADTEDVVFQSEDAIDNSGKTNAIELKAPDKDLTLQPLEPGDFPYGVYNIYVSAKGYKDMVVEGVTVFDGITSIQKISMNPLLKGRTLFKKTPIDIFIPPHQLALKEKRNLQKSFDEEIKPPKVLKQVYIPEYITVHLGTPNSYAEDVTVKFIDYIKNVGSSEIYPTWPEEALRANIYAQITFALNRVYTEWYRNKGYSFQITNSTAYDQYFVYGRNIFDSISKVVDDIFNEYVSMVSSEAPYFTQYCNGTTSICDGLSQWGTVDLANNGEDALGILQKYYGYDKIIKSTSLVEGIPSSYPGYPLRLYDNNENVKIIQEQLNRIAQNYPAIPKIENPNGYFGIDTEESVKKFQEIFNLTVDGIVGKATWYKISEIYVAVRRLSELDQEPDTDGDEYDGVYPGYILSYGARGEKVEELQTYLREISRYYDIPTLDVDGIFGNDTLSSIVVFQKLFGLAQDGLVGPITWNKIYEVYTNLPEEPIFDGVYPGYVLKYGSRGDKVIELQSYLKQISKYYGTPNLEVDGVFGRGTEDAVIVFQSIFGLFTDGIVGPKTWNKIYETYLELPKFKRDVDLNKYPGYVLKKGMKNNDVRTLQTLLKAIGKLYEFMPNVEVNGEFDEKTNRAIEAFKKNFGLVVGDKVDINTWRSLIAVYNDLASRKDINRPEYLYRYPGIELKKNDDNGYVAILKEYINVLSKNGYPVKEVFIDTSFDDELENEIKNFQKYEGLKETGVVDAKTWTKLALIYSELYTGITLKRMKKHNKHRRR